MGIISVVFISNALPGNSAVKEQVHESSNATKSNDLAEHTMSCAHFPPGRKQAAAGIFN